MKKIVKLFVIILGFIILSYVIFITEESIRLSNDVNAKPLIILDKESSYNKITYNSVGFRLTNEYGYGQLDFDKKQKVIIGQTFWLFDTFIIWGWIN